MHRILFAKDLLDEKAQCLKRRSALLEFRLLNDNDVADVEVWLNKVHVKRWYEIPRLGVTIDDCMHEINERNGAFRWLTHLIVLRQDRPIGLCQYYKCTDSV